MPTHAEISQAASNAKLLAEVDALYAELDRRIAAHQPICRNRGACCKFDTFGHKLYVTTVELAYFHAHHADRLQKQLARSERQDQGAAGFSLRDPAGCESARDTQRAAGFSPRGSTGLKTFTLASQVCPFQHDGLCTTRAGRPIGCRVFFCESSDQGWQSELTEWAISRLRELHERFEVPYSYAEWLTALAETFPE